MKGGNKMPSISLAAARVNANMTQEEVAKALNVSKNTIINWEKGRISPKYSQMVELCKLYQMPMDYIFLPDTLPKVE
jgi:DNA-binding XRE family transcriptional regulator